MTVTIPTSLRKKEGTVLSLEHFLDSVPPILVVEVVMFYTDRSLPHLKTIYSS